MSRHSINPSNLLLAAATLVLASIAVYCARGLRMEQTRAEQAATVVEPFRATPDTAAALPSAMQPAFSGVSDAPPTRGRSAANLAVARHRLARLADPQGRAEEAAQLTGIRGDWEELARFAGLTPEEVHRLTEHAVETHLQGRQQRYACEADPACEPAAYGPAQAIADEQLVRIVGAAKAASIKAHQDAAEERNFIQMMRAQMPSARNLDDTDAGRLALMLAAERQRFGRAAAQSGAVEETVDGPFAGYYMRVAVASGEASDMHRKLESATQYNERLYERAATVLHGEALAGFKAIQDATMDAYRRTLREKEVARAARRAAGLR